MQIVPPLVSFIIRKELLVNMLVLIETQRIKIVQAFLVPVFDGANHAEFKVIDLPSTPVTWNVT